MRKASAVFCAILAAAQVASADWRIISADSEPSLAIGIDHRHIVMESSDNQRPTLDFALFSTKSATLRLLDNPDGAETLADAMRRAKCIAGVNGGYFDAGYAPVGLVISDGRLIAPLRNARLLSGLVTVANGRVQLLRRTEYSLKRRPSAALQCGPFLVDHGQAVPGLDDTKPARRTFVITDGADRAGIAVCSEATLGQLAKILAVSGVAGDLKVQRALNLDGGSSSAFWFGNGGRPFSIGELKTVRNFVAVVSK